MRTHPPSDDETVRKIHRCKASVVGLPKPGRVACHGRHWAEKSMSAGTPKAATLPFERQGNPVLKRTEKCIAEGIAS